MVSNDPESCNSERILCKSTFVNFAVLSILFLSSVSDIFIGLNLIVRYYLNDEKQWSWMTLSVSFFPAMVIQALSIKMYIVNKKVKPIQWLLHFLMLGIIYRYVTAIKNYIVKFSKRNCDSNLINMDLNDLNSLYLYKSFMENTPQLVLQVYIIISSKNLYYFTVLSAAMSLLSIILALAIHTKRTEYTMCSGLLLLILWRIGMITARISALILCVYTYGAWIILFIGTHWLAMTLWLSYLKTDDCRNEKGALSTAVYAVIYCFCFFSLRNGRVKWKAITLDLLISFENLIFLTVFLMKFSEKSTELAVLSFITVVCGNIVGVSSYLLYCFCFHPNQTMKCKSSLRDTQSGNTAMCDSKSESGTRSPFNFNCKRRKQGKNSLHGQENGSEEVADAQSPDSDSVIIIEESPTKVDVSDRLPVKLNTECENVCDSGKKESIEGVLHLPAALKRRAICSSVDLSKFSEGKMDNTSEPSESNRSSKGLGLDESHSEILSMHDYENLCAVNIAREQWGIRSWRGYSDIETWCHDGSIVNERRTDNLTTSSECSGRVEDRDSIHTAEDDLPQFESESESDKASTNFWPSLQTSILDTIMEEGEVPECNSEPNYDKVKCNSQSTLVATIDKICLYTPLRNRNCVAASPCESLVMNKKVCHQSDNNERECHIGIGYEKGPAQKFLIFTDGSETGNCAIRQSNVDSTPKSKGRCFITAGKENSSLNICNNTKGEYGGIAKGVTIKEKGLLFMQALTPSKSKKRSFQITSSIT